MSTGRGASLSGTRRSAARPERGGGGGVSFLAGYRPAWWRPRRIRPRRRYSFSIEKCCKSSCRGWAHRAVTRLASNSRTIAGIAGLATARGATLDSRFRGNDGNHDAAKRGQAFAAMTCNGWGKRRSCASATIDRVFSPPHARASPSPTRPTRHSATTFPARSRPSCRWGPP